MNKTAEICETVSHAASELVKVSAVFLGNGGGKVFSSFKLGYQQLAELLRTRDFSKPLKITYEGGCQPLDVLDTRLAELEMAIERAAQTQTPPGDGQQVNYGNGIQSKRLIAVGLLHQFETQFPGETKGKTVERIMEKMGVSRSAVFGWLKVDGRKPKQISGHEAIESGLSRRRKRGT